MAYCSHMCTPAHLRAAAPATPCRLRPGTHREPNNIFGREMCAGANATEAYEGLWGWADANCDLPMPYICELEGRRPSRHHLPDPSLPDPCLPYF
jgi:hypothetical protein